MTETINAPWSFEDQVTFQLEQMRARAEAKRRFESETRSTPAIPDVKSLDTLLAEPDSPVRFCIDRVAPVDSRIMASAQYKAGKTVLVGNVIRAHADGEPLLGHFPVLTPARRIVLIDDELSENMLRRWLRDQGIINTGAVADVVCLRGKTAAFNILDPDIRTQWAKRLAELECDYLILDCLRPVLDAIGLDENHDAGTFLVNYDALLTEAGITNSLVVHHMGHTNERSRGDSRLQDWPDAIWRLVRESDEPDSPRFFSAYGRDVNVPEGRLTHDPTTRRLTYAAGSRGDAKVEAAYLAVITLLAEDAKTDSDGMSGRAIEDAIDEHSRDAIRGAVRRAKATGVVAVRSGPKRAKLHRISKPCGECGLPLSAGQSEQHFSCPAGAESLSEEGLL